MLKFFSTGHLSRYVTIFLLLVIFWIPAFINPKIYNSNAEPIFNIISGIIGVNIYFPLISAFLIIIFSELIVNQLATDFEFSSRFSALGMFFFVLLSSSIPVFFTLNPIILANVFILFLLNNIFKLPTAILAIPVVFNSGLLIGISSLFFPPLVLLLIFLWGAIIIHRLSNWRNFIAGAIGVFTPYLFLFTWYLWQESVLENINLLLQGYLIIPKISLAEFSLNYVIILLTILIIVFSALSTLAHLRGKNINLRRNLMVTILYLSFAVVIASYYSKIFESILLVVIPASLVLTNFAYQSKKTKWFNIIIYVLLVLIILNLYLGSNFKFNL